MSTPYSNTRGICWNKIRDLEESAQELYREAKNGA